MKKLFFVLAIWLLSFAAFANAPADSGDGVTSVSYNVTKTSGTLYKDGVNTGQTWSNIWKYNTSSSNPAPLMFSCAKNDIGYTNNNLVLAADTYGFTVPAGYVITGYSFKYKNFSGTTNTITIGNKELTSTSAENTETVADINVNSFILVTSGQITFSDFTISIAEVDVETVKINTQAELNPGWYYIKAVTINENSLEGKCIVNAPEFIHNGAYYALAFGDFEDNAPAKSFVKLAVKSGSNYVINSVNGHYLNQNGTVNRSNSNTTFATPNSDGQFRVGGYWIAFKPNGSSIYYVGQSSYNPNCRYELYSVNTTIYDIYTVIIKGVEEAQVIANDAQVECINAENLGIAKVYNNGYYFFPKGTEVNGSDFRSAVNGMDCVATIDSEAKTITVQYFDGYNVGLYNAISAAEAVLENTLEGTDPGCYLTADRATLQDAIDAAKVANKIEGNDYDAEITTLEAAVTAYYATVQDVKYSTAEDQTWYYIISDSEKGYCKGKVIKSNGAGVGLTFADKAVEKNAVWCFEKNNEGKVAIKNYLGEYIAYDLSSGVNETPEYKYTVEKWAGKSQSGTAYIIKPDSKNPLHAQENGTVIVNYGAADNNASLWKFIELTDEELNSTATLSSITVQRGVSAVGIGSEKQPLLRVQMQMIGLNGISEFNGLAGVLNSDVVETLYLYSVKDVYEYRSDRDDAKLLCEATPAEGGAFTFVLNDVTLTSGNSDYYWVVADIKDDATEGAVIDAEIATLTIDNNINNVEGGNPEHSTTVFLTASTVEYLNTYGSRYYRIPAITTAMNGWLVAVTDKRWDSNGDLPNNIDVVARVSKDNGKTWTEPVTIAGTAELGGDYGHGDPAIVTDRVTGDIFVLVTSKEGFYYGTPESPARLKYIVSHDNGITWDAPVDITDMIYGAGCEDETRKTWHSMFFSSGAALQTSKGTLMVVAPVRTTSNTTHSLFQAQIIRSDDHGKTWTCNAVPALYDADESKIVELNDGTLLVKSRNQNKGNVYYATSTDDGKTWSAREQFDIKDSACNGDVIRLTSMSKKEGNNRLLLSIPFANDRRNVSVFLSRDETGTWPIRKTICPGGSAYSSMTVLNDGTIGIYYEEDGLEGGYQMRYARFSLDWLTDSADHIDSEKFNAARVKEAQALAANLPDYAQTLVRTEGEKVMGATYTQYVYEVTPAETEALKSAETATDLQTIQDALTNYMDGYSKKMVFMLPEDGKVYRIKNYIVNTSEEYKYHYIANNNGTVAFPTQADNSTTLWVCQQNTDDNKRTFVSATGNKFLDWRNFHDANAANYELSAGIEKGCLTMRANNANLAVTNEAWSKGGGKVQFNQSSSNKAQESNWSTDFIFEEVSDEDFAGFAASVYEGSNGNFGTLNLPYAVYLPTGVVAKTITYNAADEKNELTENELVLDDNILPAQTPVLITGNAGAYNFVPAPALGKNAISTGFNGTLSAKAVTDANVYILAYKGNEIKFLLLDSNDNVVNANKAYFVLAEGAAVPAFFSIGYREDDTTGIDECKPGVAELLEIYDLSGRKYDGISQKGIYIVNGKKVIIK